MRGLWRRLFEAWRAPTRRWSAIDSTTAKAHRSAAGGRGGPRRRRLVARAGPHDENPRHRRCARTPHRHRSDARPSRRCSGCTALISAVPPGGAWPRMQLMTAMGCVASCESAGPSELSRTTQLGKNIIPSTRLPIASAISSNACSAASKIGDASQPAIQARSHLRCRHHAEPLSSGGPDDWSLEDALAPLRWPPTAALTVPQGQTASSRTRREARAR